MDLDMRMMEEQKKNSSDCASYAFGVGSARHLEINKN